MVLADLVLAAHAGFVAFAVAGGWLALRWRWLVWLHVPAFLWGAAVELFGWACPLTGLEHSLRAEPGAVSGEDFVGRTLLAVLYPEGLTRADQLVLGAALLFANLIAYAVLAGSIARTKRSSR
jgi:Protein of Unknown function (DUF2784)